MKPWAVIICLVRTFTPPQAQLTTPSQAKPSNTWLVVDGDAVIPPEALCRWRSMAHSPYARGTYAAAQSATAALAHARWPLGAAGRLGDGGGANARRDYPRGGASIRALDRRGPERRANRALDELGSKEQR